MPFLIIALIFFGVFYGWRLISNRFIQDKQSTQNERVFLDIETGSAKAKTVGAGAFINAPNRIYLYRGEMLKTELDGRATLTFFEDSVLHLNTATQIEFTKLKSKGRENQITVKLSNGQVWANVLSSENSNSNFKILTDIMEVKSNQATLAVSAPGTVYMISGTAEVSLLNNGKILKTYNLGVGQQFNSTQSTIDAIKRGDTPDLIFALSDSFKGSNWYRWNLKKSGADTELQDVISTEEPPKPKETEANTSTKSDETKNIEIIDENDKEAPGTPVIQSPGKNDDVVEINDIILNITGTVSADTYKVIVNDYELNKYKEGDKTFRYTASTGYKNLKAGENQYKVYAEDRAGNRSEPAVIVLNLPQSVIDEKTQEMQADSTLLPQASASGGVAFTAPNKGKSLTTNKTSFLLEGKVPEGTTKVVVNDYTLNAFKAGNTTFSYKAASTLKNLAIGVKNRFVAKAYNGSELLGQASITIDIESVGNLKITLPTEKTNYSTSLNELTLGGTVSKWAQKVYVNSKILSNYIPGSEKWKTNIKLKPGENIFSIKAIKDGDNAGADSITIILE